MVKQILDFLGIAPEAITSGALGAAIAQFFKFGLKWWERCVQILVGGVFAGYADLALLEYFPAMKSRGFAAFLAGLLSYYIIGGMMVWGKSFKKSPIRAINNLKQGRDETNQ
ncbi:hypothetical protein SAMN04515674_101491 [Pseudarcicella hirudinis]|uniref:Holin n=1 Tax=Pseudarcicella hirudinis TaxID=1079859 RepID=A0A1I5MXA9_9BACT|nr:hypothetical protein [Pseudarcicella hirudinis]SFP14128.1 hypothetical protein SAMN04515674_101491 [Pseudarcicella hirudinis]